MEASENSLINTSGYTYISAICNDKIHYSKPCTEDDSCEILEMDSLVIIKRIHLQILKVVIETVSFCIHWVSVEEQNTGNHFSCTSNHTAKKKIFLEQ